MAAGGRGLARATVDGAAGAAAAGAAAIFAASAANGSSFCCVIVRLGPARLPARGQHVVMVCDGDGELVDQHAQFVDLADHGLDAVGAGRICRHHPALDGGEAAPEFGDLTGEVRGAARQIRDLAADVGTIAQPHRHGVVEDQEGQRGERHDRGFRSADAGHRIQDQAEGGCDQHHADGDENRGNADHLAQTSPQSRCPPSRNGARCV